MASDKAIMGEISDLLNTPQDASRLKGSDKVFFESLITAQERSGNRKLTPRQRNEIKKRLSAYDPSSHAQNH